MNIDDIKTATTAELVDFYNSNSHTQIKKFSNRASAEKRVSAIVLLSGRRHSIHERRETVEKQLDQDQMVKPKSPKLMTIGSYMTELIVDGVLGDKEIFEKTKAKFPANKIRSSYVTYYRFKHNRYVAQNV